MGLHGIVVSRTAARKLLTGMVPIWTRSDAAIHLVPQLRRREAVPGIVGQNKYWEVYKARSYSSLNDVAAWQSRYKAIILRFAEFLSDAATVQLFPVSAQVAQVD